ncbi:hypothetical protein AZE42_03303 [Rhizopogon vesiculosus]|uniref:Mannan endo-1,6-alpha-mannosidase n=1 Tax=Rhizopogon vesiculosus TaxID=180088 RepID=A0A1J8R4T8_9AGAM|nr:hypothetical protein AZE42_03303 [Rhizopogon vesiculosus]
MVPVTSYFDFTPTFDCFIHTFQNSLEDLHNLMLATGNDYHNVADSSYIGKAALDPYTDWTEFLDGSNDDAQFSATQIYDIVAGQWDDVCGGGVWWSTDHSYKNAITNELFLLTSAAGYLRTNNETYLENAEKIYAFSSALSVAPESVLPPPPWKKLSLSNDFYRVSNSVVYVNQSMDFQ